MAASQEFKTFVFSETLVPESRQTLVDFLEQNRHIPIKLDCSKLEKINSLGAQLLLVAKKTWDADHQGFSISNMSESVLGMIAELGLSDFLFNSGEEN